MQAHEGRPYQTDCVNAVLSGWQNHQSVLVVLPTGTGKSWIFSDLVRRTYPKRSLILANRGELLFQAARHVQRTGLETSIEKAELQAGTGFWNKKPVVVASVQTLISKQGLVTRMHKFDPKEFGLIVCDEGHLFLAPSFRSILNYFKHGNPEIKILGVTATPARQDEIALGEVFGHCAYRYEIADAIQDGWLVPVFPLGLRVAGLDFSHIRTTAGDLNGADLARVMEAEKPLYGIAQGTLEQVFGLEANELHGVPVESWNKFLLDFQCAPRSALVFTVSVKHAEMLSGIFNRVVPNISAWVSGKTPENERGSINAKFKNGEVPILCNCGTHTTGFDAPVAEIIVPKPTKSWSLFAQMCGRGFRPAEVAGASIVDRYATAELRREAISHSRKPRVTVLDFHGVSGKHKLITPFDILGGRHSPEAVALAIKRSREKNHPVNMTDEMVAAEDEIHKRIEQARLQEAQRKTGLMGRARFTVSTHSLFDNTDRGDVRMIQRASPKVVSEKMARICRQMGFNPHSMPYAQAVSRMREGFGRWNKHKKTK
jgi:superfamily II DNA or RNA helicase